MYTISQHCFVSQGMIAEKRSIPKCEHAVGRNGHTACSKKDFGIAYSASEGMACSFASSSFGKYRSACPKAVNEKQKGMRNINAPITA